MAPKSKKSRRTTLPAGVTLRADGQYVVRITMSNRTTRQRVERMQVVDGGLALSAVLKIKEEMKEALRAEIETEEGRVQPRKGGTQNKRSPPPLAPEITFCDFAEQWLKRKARSKMRENTAMVRATVLAHHIIPRLGDLQIGEITRATMVSYRSWLEEQGEEKGHALISVRGRWKLALQIYKDACADLGIHDITLRLEPPDIRRKPPVREERTLSAREVVLCCKRAEELGLRYWIMIPLLGYLGIRRGEATALRWCDVDLKQNIIHVRRSAVLLGEGRWQIAAPKSGRARATGVAPALHEALLRWREANPPEGDEDLIMAGDDGATPPQRHITDRLFVLLERSVKEAVGKHLTPQVLRRSWVSISVATGLDDALRRSMVGHAGSDMTDLYHAPTPATTASAAQFMWESTRDVGVVSEKS